VSTVSESLVIEACVTSRRQVADSFARGARRTEFCRALDVGGLTAGSKDIVAALTSAPGPVFALVRAQAETFRLTPRQVATLVADVERVAALGVDGVVVGVLDRSGRVDVAAMTELVGAAGGLPVTFHRAFDELGDPVAGVEPLIRAGVRRVLTAGGAPTAWEGRETLGRLVTVAGDDLVILAGGGVRGDHVRGLVERTGLREVHARAAAIAGIVEALSESG
jgi:copper homeostasis protein